MLNECDILRAMIIIHSKNSVPIRITQERWQHIENRHPELQHEKDKVIETVGDPDLILEGDFGELLALRLYEDTPFGKKYLAVIYKEIEGNDGFILTAYVTNSPSRKRRVLWKR